MDSGDKEAASVRVKLRIINVFSKWIELRYHSIARNSSLLAKFQTFLKGLRNGNDMGVKWANHLDKLLVLSYISFFSSFSRERLARK